MKETAPTGTRTVPSLGPAKSRAKMLCCSSCHLCGMNHFSSLHPQRKEASFFNGFSSYGSFGSLSCGWIKHFYR
ncbi:hypothetical protein OIU79_009360 [Salix purpurea]|uniref:Uncharacterized protein n=1 Tax=Salix purpurea TaxID=77065 RepID=A0A9Q0TKN7_SALPP|nr:hypothetical protein OIU79_009360 [Salix purpurea]